MCLSILARKVDDRPQFYGISSKFQYRLIPLPDMEESWSVKRYTANPPGPFDPNLVKYSVYPFNDLPPFKLHVPYHFVIVNTGKKLLQLYGMEAINFESDFPFLLPSARNIMRAVRNIYVAWMLAVPDPIWLSGEGYNDEQNSAAEWTRRHAGVGSDGNRQGRGESSGGKGGKSQAQDAAAGPSSAQMEWQHATVEFVAPSDSASCLEPFELVDGGNDKEEDKPYMDDEDDEYEDDEFFRGLKQWVSDVWTATHADSGSDSEVTLVGGAAAPALSKDVDTAILLAVQSSDFRLFVIIFTI